MENKAVIFFCFSTFYNIARTFLLAVFSLFAIYIYVCVWQTLHLFFPSISKNKEKHEFSWISIHDDRRRHVDIERGAKGHGWTGLAIERAINTAKWTGTCVPRDSTYVSFFFHSSCTTSRRRCCHLPFILWCHRTNFLPMFLIAFHPIFREWRNLVEQTVLPETGPPRNDYKPVSQRTCKHANRLVTNTFCVYTFVGKFRVFDTHRLRYDIY